MHLFYNAKPFDTLMIELSDQATTRMEVYEHLVVLFNNDDIIGYNILNASQSIHFELRNGLNDASEKLIDNINHQLTENQLSPLPKSLPKYFVVGHVLSKEAVKDSDKLSVLRVNVGDEELQIVCGAKNVDVNQKVVVAKIGARMPSGLRILPSKLKGIDSFGMICSASELGIETLSSTPGILVLDDHYEVGKIYER